MIDRVLTFRKWAGGFLLAMVVLAVVLEVVLGLSPRPAWPVVLAELAAAFAGLMLLA